ncbi:MAG: hypothetical protein CM1200mP23_0430 [Nitrososphaerota archaeon]|nr:MAG: hypothetical protein CM1200mP23_0430 [Nitrososphaerota archaeon]
MFTKKEKKKRGRVKNVPIDMIEPTVAREVNFCST